MAGKKISALASDNRLRGRQFLSENAKKDGITTLPSGLQYRVIQPGAGRHPAKTDRVTVRYRGTLLDGSEFDSSSRRNKPASFRVDRVIRGWTEALQLMKVGAHWQLFVPPHLGYGERTTGTGIPLNSTLVFDLELLAIE